MSKKLKLNSKCIDCGSILYYYLFSKTVRCEECNTKVTKKLSKIDNLNIESADKGICAYCHRKIINKWSQGQRFCSVCGIYHLVRTRHLSNLYKRKLKIILLKHGIKLADEDAKRFKVE